MPTTAPWLSVQPFPFRIIFYLNRQPNQITCLNCLQQGEEFCSVGCDKTWKHTLTTTAARATSSPPSRPVTQEGLTCLYSITCIIVICRFLSYGLWSWTSNSGLNKIQVLYDSHSYKTTIKILGRFSMFKLCKDTKHSHTEYNPNSKEKKPHTLLCWKSVLLGRSFQDRHGNADAAKAYSKLRFFKSLRFGLWAAPAISSWKADSKNISSHQNIHPTLTTSHCLNCCINARLKSNWFTHRHR